MLPQIHSVSALNDGGCQETVSCLSARWLRPYVAGYAGFRASPDGCLRRRVLPLNLTTLIIDFDGASRLVTGPRGKALLYEQPGWRHGVAVGLTPAGTVSLLRTPFCELVGRIAPLDDLVGRCGVRLADRLGALPDWPTRFAALDRWFTGRLDTDEASDGTVMRAWWRLQDSAEGITIGALAAELGVSQRHLQIGFEKHIGLPPKTVARIARFQRAVSVLSKPSATVAMAASHGYADQSHFHRETRAMAGVTPGELFAFVQYSGRSAR